MKLTSPTQVRDLLTDLGVTPKRSMGQNFLIDRNILNIIRNLADLRPEDTILEVGPGLGVLTDEFAGLTRHVTAIEMDAKLSRYLRGHFEDAKNVDLIESDALDVDLEGLVAGGVTKFISNLPYSAGTRILLRLITAPEKVPYMLVMIQKDVAERLTAESGHKNYGMIAVCAQLYYEVKIEKDVSPTCFYPVPDVWSTVLSLRRRDEPLYDIHNPKHFLALLKWAFGHRRKQIQSLLHHGPARLVGKADIDKVLEKAGIEPASRPEVLSIETWGRLANTLAAAM